MTLIGSQNTSNLLTAVNPIFETSLMMLNQQRPAYYSWIITAAVNVPIAIFLLIVLPRWKIYDDDTMFILK